MPAARNMVPSGEEIVIVIIQTSEVVLSPAVSSERGAVRKLLQIVQAAGDAPVAVGVECVEVDAGTSDDA